MSQFAGRMGGVFAITETAMDTIQRLQSWYGENCDGRWEHQYGVLIETLDNPGWKVVIDLVGTDLESMQMESIVEENNESDWMNCKIENRKFVGNGGPFKLDVILRAFLDLVPAA